jgi:hypothetical protein
MFVLAKKNLFLFGVNNAGIFLTSQNNFFTKDLRLGGRGHKRGRVTKNCSDTVFDAVQQEGWLL